MSNDDDMLAEYDLSAWDAPPPPADLADAVIDRMGGTDVGIAVPVEDQRAPRRSWIIGGVAVAVVLLGLGIWSLVRSTHRAAPSSGGVLADRARTLELDNVHADLDAGADVRWRRDGGVWLVEQRAGRATWHVDGDERLVVVAGAGLASVEATDANLRVEVQMNAMDARVIGASALTAAAVAMVTVVVYEGHVKVGRGVGQQTVVVAPGSTYSVKGEDEAASLVGGGPVATASSGKKVAVLGLQLDGKYGADAPVVTQVMGATIRSAAQKDGRYQLALNADKELMDEKLLMNCANEAAPCMAAIGADLGVDMLVFGHIEQQNVGYQISAKLLDVAKKEILVSGQWVMPTKEAEGAGLDKWGTKIYADLTAGNMAYCDADALKEQGMENINLGQHAAALAKFEESLGCRQDSYVVQLAFMESCSSGNSPKAKLYYKQLTPAQQTKFGQICIRQKVAFMDDSDAAGCDEVSCVLSNYDGECCEKFKASSIPDGLDRVAISDAMAKVKDQVLACGEKTKASGKVKVKVRVAPAGNIAQVEIETTPKPEAGLCVATAIKKAKFPVTKNGGAFSYPFILSGGQTTATAPPPAYCDADALKEQGMENINMGQHAAALAKFEASLACKGDPYVVQLAFMESCQSVNAAKAKKYFKQMTQAQREKFEQICIRNKVYLTDVDTDPTVGFLQLATQPANARVLIDGADTGLRTPISGQTLPIKPGKHKVTIVVDGERFTYPVNIKAGVTEKMFKDLQ